MPKTLSEIIDARLRICEAAPKGPWRVGRVLSTRMTRRMSREEIARHELRERGHVFANFGAGDAGKSRTLIADCWHHGVTRNSHENAAFIAHARQGYPEALEALKVAVEALEKIASGSTWAPSGGAFLPTGGTVAAREVLATIRAKMQEPTDA